MEANRLSSISKADSDEKIGEFWNSHDLTKFDTDALVAEFEVKSRQQSAGMKVEPMRITGCNRKLMKPLSPSLLLFDKRRLYQKARASSRVARSVRNCGGITRQGGRLFRVR